MPTNLLVVQFTHPGKEPIITKAERNIGIKSWNQGTHARKFLKAKGQIVTPQGLSPKQKLLFWGEWEPTSKIQPVNNYVGNNDQPKWVHIPFLPKKKSQLNPGTNAGTCLSAQCVINSSLQNTDPFVFGSAFYYSLCRQNHFTRLRTLARGSIILFGSPIMPKNPKGYFALDTVFVVDDYKVYDFASPLKSLKGFIPKDYPKIMGFSHWKGHMQLVCYKGATVNNPVNGMYSFVPCKPCNGSVTGFPRIKLTNSNLQGVISNNLTSSLKYTVSSLTQNKQIWDTVRQLVKNGGLYEGVNFDY